MNVEKLPKLTPIEIGYRIDASLPVIPFAMEVNRAGCAAPHAHPRGQFIYASSGVMRVVSREAIWVVPPSQGVWVPPEVDHEVYFPGEVALRNLFIDPSVTPVLPPACAVLKVSPLLRELILRAVEVGEEYRPETAAWRLMQVLVDELRRAEETKLSLPMARDERLARVIDALLKEPGDRRDLQGWAKVAGASPRTLARLFLRDTGLTFAGWRRRLLLQEAVDRLGSGATVTQVAFDLGYQSLSAFIEMFRQEMGAPPAQYARQRGSTPSPPGTL
ncbi:helix-turn-helix transcriptional regulator [Geomonas sp. RF6]|uniref:AraC family transcriptional regulator n=1 Tax=Geomonas sp. RF6 TaxID=2897342 RepID=UPI001E298375|nr:helix-turn-helix transcriptional regulator [Geomonas sp. RF6]UFS72009.1 helix-turn-helix transcriptional regulator [Geomonas sp. RF6]